MATQDQGMAKEIVIAWLEYLGEAKITSLGDPEKASGAIETVFKADMKVIGETGRSS